MEERRRSARLHVPLNVEVILSEMSKDYILGDIRDFSAEGFSFEAKDIDFETNEIIIARFKLYPESKHMYIKGKVIWKIQIGDDCQIGIQVIETESEIDSQELGYPFNMWKDKIKK